MAGHRNPAAGGSNAVAVGGIVAAMTDTDSGWIAPELSLDRLADMTADELTDLYQNGRVPARGLEALSGAPHCRMLAIRGPLGRGPLATALRHAAASPAFPWAGKRFSPRGPDQGSGCNRVRLPGLQRLDPRALGSNPLRIPWAERDVFGFATGLAHSAIDGLPCILLDYDRPENPWPIRRIRDELREVAPGLFLGPALWRTRGQPILLFFFATDLG